MSKRNRGTKKQQKRRRLKANRQQSGHDYNLGIERLKAEVAASAKPSGEATPEPPLSATESQCPPPAIRGGKLPEEPNLTKPDETVAETELRDYYTLREMMEMFGVSRSTLTRLHEDGAPLGRFKLRGTIRYLKSAVHQYVASQSSRTG